MISDAGLLPYHAQYFTVNKAVNASIEGKVTLLPLPVVMKTLILVMQMHS
jgi:hypothetical protein